MKIRSEKGIIAYISGGRNAGKHVSEKNQKFEVYMDESGGLQFRRKEKSRQIMAAG